MPIISVGNQKGGTGKTSTVYAMGEILAGAYNKRVLMVDLDPQSSLTYLSGIKVNKSLSDVFSGGSLNDAVTSVGGDLFLLPSDIRLAEMEIKSPGLLRKVLAPVKDVTDYILLDLPPALNELTANGLVASDWVLITARPTLLDVAGLDLFLDTVHQAQALNQALKVVGVLFTFYDSRILSMKEIIKKLEKLHIFKQMIGQSIRVAESKGGSVVTQHPSNPRAREYVNFVSELLKVIK